MEPRGGRSSHRRRLCPRRHVGSRAAAVAAAAAAVGPRPPWRRLRPPRSPPPSHGSTVAAARRRQQRPRHRECCSPRLRRQGRRPRRRPRAPRRRRRNARKAPGLQRRKTPGCGRACRRGHSPSRLQEAAATPKLAPVPAAEGPPNLRLQGPRWPRRPRRLQRARGPGQPNPPAARVFGLGPPHRCLRCAAHQRSDRLQLHDLQVGLEAPATAAPPAPKPGGAPPSPRAWRRPRCRPDGMSTAVPRPCTVAAAD